MKQFFKKIIDKIKSVDKGTLCRTILQVCAYANQFIALLGYSSFASSPVYQWISFGITLTITVVTFWYNNDWSSLAILIGEIFDMVKDGRITREEIEDFKKKHQKKEDEQNSADGTK